MAKNRISKHLSGQVTLNLGDGKPLLIRRGNESLSPFGGLPLIAKVERLVKIVAGAVERLNDRRTQALIDHQQFDLVFARVLQISAGLADGNDADLVADDGAMLKSLGRDPETGLRSPSQPTLSRQENAIEEEELQALYDWLIDYYMSRKSKKPRRVVLYIDGSAVETYGNQEGAIYRGGKYKKEMYFPLFVFDETGWLLLAELREGDQGEVKRGRTALIAIIKKLQARWPGVKIGVRADAAFASPRLFVWLEEKGVDYIIGIAGNFAIAIAAQDYHRDARRRFKRKFGEPEFTGTNGKRKKHKLHAKIRRMGKKRRAEATLAWKRRRVRVYGEVSYRARTWKQDRRVICRCDYTDDGLECRYVVTNIKLTDPRYLYEKDYCPHANVERSIKEFKNGMLLQLSCQTFRANAFRVILHGLAYQLLYHLRQYLGPKLQSLSVDTIRKTFINVAVKISSSERHIGCALSNTYAYKNEFLRLARKLARAT